MVTEIEKQILKNQRAIMKCLFYNSYDVEEKLKYNINATTRILRIDLMKKKESISEKTKDALGH